MAGLPAPLQGAVGGLTRTPVVSLRSTTGYRLERLRRMVLAPKARRNAAPGFSPGTLSSPLTQKALKGRRTVSFARQQEVPGTRIWGWSPMSCSSESRESVIDVGWSTSGAAVQLLDIQDVSDTPTL